MAWGLQADVAGSFADEAGLVAGLRAGKPEAFATLHAGYAAPIYNLALRIVEDPHDAQDVAQEVLIKVLKGLPSDGSELKLPAWLYRVTVNAAFDHVRARKRRPLAVIDGTMPEPVAVVDEFERAELGRRVDSALRELPKRQQVALVLRDVHGLSVGETASVLGLTKGSADVLLSRARAGFRKIYLAGTAALGRCSEADRILAGGVGGGVSAADRALLKEHARTCPDCRDTVGLWGVAPVGLGLLLPQVALPARLSLGATLAAAQAAGVAVPAGLAAAAATGPAAATGTAAAAGGSAASASATALTGAAAPVAATAGGAGVLAALGSAAAVKVATLAVVAAAAVGVAGIATHSGTDPGGSDVGAARFVRAGAVAPAASAGAGLGGGERAHARMLTGSHHDGVGAAGDRRGTVDGARQGGGGTGGDGSAVQGGGGDASQVKAQGGQAAGEAGTGSAGGGAGTANGGTTGGTSTSGSGGGGGGSTGGTPSSGAGGGSTGGPAETGSGGSGGGGQPAGE